MMKGDSIMDIKELLNKRQDLKMELREVEHELINVVENFEGTLNEAVRLGLVKFNFTVPQGYYRSIHNR